MATYERPDYTHNPLPPTTEENRKFCMGDLMELATGIAKPQMTRGKETKRKFMGVSHYYWQDLPQLETQSIRHLDYLLEERDRDYKSALIILYEGGDTIGWHKDKKNKEFTNDNVVMYNFGFVKKPDRLLKNFWDYVPVEKGTELGYLETETEKIPITHDSRIEMKAYDIKHKAKTWKRKNFTWRINITLRK